MAKINIITVQDVQISVSTENNNDYICLTDMLKGKEGEDHIRNWMRNRNSLEFLGTWELLHNPNFKGVEFDTFLHEAGANRFNMTPRKWIDATDAIGIISKSGRNGGTYAHRDIAFEFGSWLSPVFKLYLIKEYERLKEEEQKVVGWSAKRELAKINYHIHTSAISHNLIPKELSKEQINYIYANEADVLNVALFGMTAKEWRNQNPDLKGNIRDYATINELICLSNMENINAVLINDGISQKERLIKLNQIAIQQMRVLQDNENRKLLKSSNKQE